MKEQVIAIFDIGKTNKKLLLFNRELKLVSQMEEKFPVCKDDDGDECDDIDLIEEWILSALKRLIKSKDYDLLAVNFSTYGASLAFLGEEGERLTPIYNYLKDIPSDIQEELFSAYGGKAEFCRRTASPALGMLLNSGIQMLWLKKKHQDVFSNVKAILHFPQYLSYLLTKKVVSESTSIGCHTFLWDFDHQTYHPWLKDNGIRLPDPEPNNVTIPVELAGHKFFAGIGIHDSSSSLAPYILGSKQKFILVSTGTWCINMNPYNHTPLTDYQLEHDCLSFLSVDQHPVKSSRLFMGHIHDLNTKRISEYFNVDADQYKKVRLNEELIASYLRQGKDPVFFHDGVPDSYLDDTIDLSGFQNFDEAYHRLIFDLTLLNIDAINLIKEPDDEVEILYVSGGFARNPIFIRLLAAFFPELKVYTSEVDNSSALGAAVVIWNVFSEEGTPDIDLGLMS